MWLCATKTPSLRHHAITAPPATSKDTPSHHLAQNHQQLRVNGCAHQVLTPRSVLCVEIKLRYVSNDTNCVWVVAFAGVALCNRNTIITPMRHHCTTSQIEDVHQFLTAVPMVRHVTVQNSSPHTTTNNPITSVSDITPHKSPCHRLCTLTQPPLPFPPGFGCLLSKPNTGWVW